MYKNLSPSAIGVFGRQSELVEIALTHRFKGLEIDITEVLKRAQTSTVQQACRYLCSAPMKIGGFELPIRWAAAEAEFESDLKQAPLLRDVCTTLAAEVCYTTIRPTCDQRPFHENFQFHVERLGKVADALAPANIKLALSFLAAQSERSDGGFEFIHQVDPLLLLVNGIRRDNVGLLFDDWNWQVGGGDTDKLRSLKGDQIISVRLADMPAGTELASAKVDQRVLPGEGGVIDCGAIVAALEEIGFEGPVAAAPWPGLFKGEKREVIVSKASAALDAVMGNVTGDRPLAAAEQ